MSIKGFKRKFPPLEILSKEEVDQIKMATLDILKETGITLNHKGALKLLEKNDCTIDYDNERVRFPEGLTEECLRRCPSSFRLKTRDPNKDIVIGRNSVHFMAAPGLGIADARTGEFKVPTEQEYIEGVKILDALENQAFLPAYTPYFGYEGVPEIMKMTMGFLQGIRYSAKFPTEGNSNRNWEFHTRIAKVAKTEMTSCSMQVSPPLTIGAESVEATFNLLENDFPTGVDTGPVMGATAPSTIAGAIAQFNAELIAGIILIQVKKPYSRVLVWGFPNPQNMQTGAPNFGNIANSLHNVSVNQIWRDYGVPLRNTACAYTNSKKVDWQNGMERAIPAILAAVSGASWVHLHGGLHGELSFNPELAILDDDMAGMIGRFIEGVDVNEETIALDLINSVGPVPGNFLDKRHTLNWWKGEQYTQKSADTLTYQEWKRTGKKDCIDYARERKKKILAEHKVSVPLTEEQNEEINNIIKEAEGYYKKLGKL